MYCKAHSETSVTFVSCMEQETIPTRSPLRELHAAKIYILSQTDKFLTNKFSFRGGVNLMLVYDRYSGGARMRDFGL